MKPYPFAPLNHFTVPFSLTNLLLSAWLKFTLALREAFAPKHPPKELKQRHPGLVLVAARGPKIKSPKTFGKRFPEVMELDICKV